MVSASSPEDEESPEGDEPSFLGLDKWCIVARESWEQKERSVRGQEGQGESQVGDWGAGR